MAIPSGTLNPLFISGPACSFSIFENSRCTAAATVWAYRVVIAFLRDSCVARKMLPTCCAVFWAKKRLAWGLNCGGLVGFLETNGARCWRAASARSSSCCLRSSTDGPV